jgi:glycosidase
MQIYVRGYQDSDGDGIGDLRGLIQRLDYLKDLGVSGLWLMPVTQSQDNNHGYAVTNYRAIESQYGTLADFDELLRQAHARGMGVIIDYVMNHSGVRHPVFLNSRASSGNAFRDWYLWQGTKPTGWSIYGSDPWRSETTGFYFGPFSMDMPDFNLTHPAVVNWHHDNLRFWLNRGVDGFRFDAVGHLVENGPNAWDNQPQNYPIMGAVRSVLNGYAQRYMVCEAPGDPIGFTASTACGSAFAFGLQSILLRAVQGDVAALQSASNYFNTAPHSLATFLSNHDSFAGARPWDQLGGNISQLKLAASLYLLLPGIPFVYYGEEIGMSAGAGLSGDSSLRVPMSWTGDAARAGFTTGSPFRALATNVQSQNLGAQQTDAQSLWSHYRALIQLRRTRASLSRGSYEEPRISGNVLTFRRQMSGEETLVMINTGEPVRASIPNLQPSVRYRVLLPASVTTVEVTADGTLTLDLPARSTLVLAP